MLEQEYLMRRTVAEVKCLVHFGDADVLTWNAKHDNGYGSSSSNQSPDQSRCDHNTAQSPGARI